MMQVDIFSMGGPSRTHATKSTSFSAALLPLLLNLDCQILSFFKPIHLMVWYRRPNYSYLALLYGHKYKHSLFLQHLELLNRVYMVTSWVTALSCSGKRVACHVEGGSTDTMSNRKHPIPK